jgi:hypothetical protein
MSGAREDPGIDSHAEKAAQRQDIHGMPDNVAVRDAITFARGWTCPRTRA